MNHPFDEYRTDGSLTIRSPVLFDRFEYLFFRAADHQLHAGNVRIHLQSILRPPIHGKRGGDHLPLIQELPQLVAGFNGYFKQGDP